MEESAHTYNLTCCTLCDRCTLITQNMSYGCQPYLCALSHVYPHAFLYRCAPFTQLTLFAKSDEAPSHKRNFTIARLPAFTAQISGHSPSCMCTMFEHVFIHLLVNMAVVSEANLASPSYSHLHCLFLPSQILLHCTFWNESSSGFTPSLVSTAPQRYLVVKALPVKHIDSN